MDLDHARAYIRDNHHAVMATVRHDGRPQLSPVACAVDDEGLVVVSTRETAYKVKNLERDPRVSLCVIPDGFFGEWVQVDGDRGRRPPSRCARRTRRLLPPGRRRAPRLGRLPERHGARAPGAGAHRAGTGRPEEVGLSASVDASTSSTTPSSSRYLLLDDGAVVGVADYRDRGDALVFHHTEIDRARRGHGLGAILVRGALDDVAARGRTIVPTCWFVAEFLDVHPDYADLIAA